MADRLIKRIRLTSANPPKNTTQHYHGDRLLPPPAELRIVQFDGDPGFYLLYIDAEGNEQTDTFHDTVDAAVDQAEFEFVLSACDWENVDVEET